MITTVAPLLSRRASKSLLVDAFTTLEYDRVSADRRHERSFNGAMCEAV